MDDELDFFDNDDDNSSVNDVKPFLTFTFSYFHKF